MTPRTVIARRRVKNFMTTLEGAAGKTADGETVDSKDLNTFLESTSKHISANKTARESAYTSPRQNSTELI